MEISSDMDLLGPAGLHIEEKMAKEDGARLSGALFIGHLAAHFRLVGDKGLRSLSVVAWVASRPERHQAATAGAPVAVEDTPVGDAGAPTVPAPLQAPQPSPAPQHRTMS
nr:hypothetical protein [Tanacetum cinerariifolium]